MLAVAWVSASRTVGAPCCSHAPRVYAPQENCTGFLFGANINAGNVLTGTIQQDAIPVLLGTAVTINKQKRHTGGHMHLCSIT
jgi:hypothetical protein